MTIKLNRKQGRLYMLVTRDEPILDNADQTKDLILNCTFSCDKFLEFRVRALEDWEKENVVEDALSEILKFIGFNMKIDYAKRTKNLKELAHASLKPQSHEGAGSFLGRLLPVLKLILCQRRESNSHPTNPLAILSPKVRRILEQRLVTQPMMPLILEWKHEHCKA